MKDRVVKTLQDLLRFDTTNPPGNEIICANYLRERLSAEGIESMVLESAPGRANLVARLKGDGSQRPLLLMSHTDVVRTEPEKWTHPPFAGEIADGYLFGRGAVDMKNLGAIELELFLELNRHGGLKRDVILAATADEETGGSMGMQWLVDNHFELVDAEYGINEGGGHGYLINGRWLFTCQTAEKGVCWTKVRAHGVPGHASAPPRNTSVQKLLKAVNSLAQGSMPLHKVRTVESFINTMADLLPDDAAVRLRSIYEPGKEEDALAALPNPDMANLLRAAIRNTATPTVLAAGAKTNVVPSEAEAQIDCRVLPGSDDVQAQAEMRSFLGDEVELETMIYSAPTESGFQTPMFDTIKEVMNELEPGSLVAPWMSTGGTDSRFLAKRGVSVYGFCPVRIRPGDPGMMQLAHAHDERISLENLDFASQALWQVVSRLCL